MKILTSTRLTYMAAATLGLAVLGWNQLGKQDSAPRQDFTRTPSFSSAPVSQVAKPSQPDSVQAPASEQLRSQVDLLRENVATLIEHQSLTQEDLDGLRDSIGTESSSVDERLPVTPEEDAASIESNFSHMTAYLERETPDPAWSGETRASIEHSLSQAELSGATLLESTCGSTLCKVKLNLPPDRSPQESLQRLAAQRSWDGATMFKLSGNGEVDFYIARLGHELPVE